MTNYALNKMIDTLARLTHAKSGCFKQNNEYICKLGYNGVLAPLKTVEKCKECVEKAYKL